MCETKPCYGCGAIKWYDEYAMPRLKLYDTVHACHFMSIHNSFDTAVLQPRNMLVHPLHKSLRLGTFLLPVRGKAPLLSAILYRGTVALAQNVNKWV